MNFTARSTALRTFYCDTRRLYAVDNNVVLVRPTPAPSSTQSAPFDDMNAVPFLTDRGRDGYWMFLNMHRPRAFVIAADGGWNATTLGLIHLPTP
jgi:hypothetical protein